MSNCCVSSQLVQPANKSWKGNQKAAQQRNLHLGWPNRNFPVNLDYHRNKKLFPLYSQIPMNHLSFPAVFEPSNCEHQIFWFSMKDNRLSLNNILGSNDELLDSFRTKFIVFNHSVLLQQLFYLSYEPESEPMLNIYNIWYIIHHIIYNMYNQYLI